MEIKQGYSVDTTKYIDRVIRFGKANRIHFDLKDPKTIQDKLEWLNIYDVDPLKTKCADKLLLHEYCKDTLGVDICVPIIKSYDKVEDVDLDKLPKKFVIKCNHGSGMNVIVLDKNEIDPGALGSLLQRWLNTNFAMQNGFEAHYYDIPRKIIVEKYMTDGHKDSLHDYKFWCFNGEPKFYTINSGNGHGDIMYYKMNGTEWNLYGVPHHDEYQKPKNFNEMKKFAKKLAAPFKFVRIDFYEIKGVTYLGEMTFTPGACVFKYKDPKNEIKVGDMLTLDIPKEEPVEEKKEGLFD